MAVAQRRQMRQMLHFWKQIKKKNSFKVCLNSPPFASLYSDPAYGRGCMTVDLFEFCNRKASKYKSINNHSIFRWFLPLHWLFLNFLCFVWYISFRFVILDIVSFRFVVFRFVSFRFVFVSQFSSTRKRGLIDPWVLLNWETKTKKNETKYNETKRKMKKRNDIYIIFF